MIIKSIYELLEESAAKKSKKKSENKDPVKTADDYSNYIKWNRMKKGLVRKGIIRIGMPQQFFGPHERDKERKLLAAQNMQQIEQAKTQKQEQDFKQVDQDIKVSQALSKQSIPQEGKRPNSPNLKPSIPREEFKPSSNQPSKKDTSGAVGMPKPVSTPGEVMKKVIKLTKGMRNNIKGYSCKECNFPIIKYKGRYPKKCVNCDKPLIRDKIIK